MKKAVLHITKYHGSLGGLGDHIDRTKQPENAHEYLSHLNLQMIKPKGTISEDVNARIEQGYNGKRKIRDNQVKYIGIITSGSHEQMKEIESKGQLMHWAEDSYQFICKKFGKENIVRATIHLDEKTPHIHFGIVPITNDGRLCAKNFLDGKQVLRDIQTDYAQIVEKYGLERGIYESKTKHTTTAQYYKYVNENKLKASDILKDKNAIELVSKLIEIADTNNNLMLNHNFLQDERRILQEIERRKIAENRNEIDRGDTERNKGFGRGFKK